MGVYAKNDDRNADGERRCWVHLGVEGSSQHDGNKKIRTYKRLSASQDQEWSVFSPRSLDICKREEQVGSHLNLGLYHDSVESCARSCLVRPTCKFAAFQESGSRKGGCTSYKRCTIDPENTKRGENTIIEIDNRDPAPITTELVCERRCRLNTEDWVTKCNWADCQQCLECDIIEEFDQELDEQIKLDAEITARENSMAQEVFENPNLIEVFALFGAVSIVSAVVQKCFQYKNKDNYVNIEQEI